MKKKWKIILHHLRKKATLIAEGERLLKKVPANSYLIVLDVFGKDISSEELSAKIDKLTLSGQSHITFLIGGAFGLSEEVRKRADERISFFTNDIYTSNDKTSTRRTNLSCFQKSAVVKNITGKS